MQFVIPSVIEARYQLQRAETVSSAAWDDVGAEITGDGGDITLSDPGPLSSNHFYHLLIQL